MVSTKKEKLHNRRPFISITDGTNDSYREAPHRGKVRTARQTPLQPMPQNTTHKQSHLNLEMHQ